MGRDSGATECPYRYKPNRIDEITIDGRHGRIMLRLLDIGQTLCRWRVNGKGHVGDVNFGRSDS
jgi:hypothetical protein